MDSTKKARFTMKRTRVSGILSLLMLLVASPLCEAQVINSRVVSFLNARLARRVGGGECSDAVTEALRTAGGEFDRTDLGRDTPAVGDFVWGTLKKSISFTGGRAVDSHPTVKLVPGDIIQYRNARFNMGTVIITTTQHTSVVSAVDSAGKVTFVLQQNFAGTRAVRKDAIDLMKITSGYVRIYTPKARGNVSRKFKFTIVNNTATEQVVRLRNGTTVVGQLRLKKTNTIGSMNVASVTTAGTINQPNFLTANNKTLPITNVGGYEVYLSGGAAALRKLSP
jgi:hypothetical protein